MPVGIAASLTIEANRIAVNSARVTIGRFEHRALGRDSKTWHRLDGDSKFDANVFGTRKPRRFCASRNCAAARYELRGNATWRGGVRFLRGQHAARLPASPIAILPSVWRAFAPMAP